MPLDAHPAPCMRSLMSQLRAHTAVQDVSELLLWKVATLRSISNLKRSLDITQQVLTGASLKEVGEMEAQEPKVGSWATERRGRGKSVREASPELVRPNKYANLHDDGDISSGVAVIEQAPTPSCQGRDGSNKERIGDTGKAR